MTAEYHKVRRILHNEDSQFKAIRDAATIIELISINLDKLSLRM